MEPPTSPAAAETPSTRPLPARLTLDELTAVALGTGPERLSPAQLYLGLRGRLPRQAYWLKGVLALFLASFALNGLLAIARVGDDTAAWIVILAFVWPCIAVTAKRLHDFNLASWWLPLGLLGFGLSMKLLFNLSAWWLLGNFVGIGTLVMLVAGLVPGTHGPNRFGVDPREALARARINSDH